MAGIDFRELRAAITMRDVVELIDFVPTVVRGDQLRGSVSAARLEKSEKHESFDQSCQERLPLLSVRRRREPLGSLGRGHETAALRGGQGSFANREEEPVRGRRPPQVNRSTHRKP